MEIKRQKIPQEIVEVYLELVAARDKYSKALETYKPEPPVKEGDIVMFTEYGWSRPKKCIVERVSYTPYNHYTHKDCGGWKIIVRTIKKNGERTLNKSFMHATNDSKIELL